MFYHHFRKTANINVKKLTGLNLALRTPNETSKTANVKIVNPTRPLPGCPYMSLIESPIPNISCTSLYSSVHVKVITDVSLFV